MALKIDPFAPDVEVYHETTEGRRVLALAKLAVSQLAPVTLLLGEPGVGKTTLARRLAETDVPGLRIGFMAGEPGKGGADDPFRRFFAAFEGRRSTGEAEGARDRFLRSLVKNYEGGRTSLLIVDDAHRATEDDLWTLQMLLTVGAAGACPLILLLVGEPALVGRLRGPRLARLGQRVEATVALGPMSPDETAALVERRLAAADLSEPLFRDEALAALHDRAHGAPGAVLAAASRCLAAAAGTRSRRIDAAFVHDVLDSPPDPGDAEMSSAGADPPAEPRGPGSVGTAYALPYELRDLRSLGPEPSTALGKGEGPAAAGADDRSGRAATRAEEPPAAEYALADAPAAPTTPTPPDLPPDADGPRARARGGHEPPLNLVDPVEPDDEEGAAPEARRRGVFGRGGQVVGGLLSAALVLGVGAFLILQAIDRPADPEPDIAFRSLGADGGAATADELYARALELGPTEVEETAIAYARAALRGHDRAAYFLGQLYETGDGVPLDTSLALAWYRRAADGLEVARRRAADLSPASGGGASAQAAPKPLYSGRMEGGEAEFVWTGSPGAGRYVIELAREAGGDPVQSETVEASAARLSLAGDGVSHWRVAADGDPEAATPWLPIDAGRWIEE